MKKILLGNHPITSILGLIAGTLMYLQQLLEQGESDSWKIAIAVALFLLGRMASDANITTQEEGQEEKQ